MSSSNGSTPAHRRYVSMPNQPRSGSGRRPTPPPKQHEEQRYWDTKAPQRRHSHHSSSQHSRRRHRRHGTQVPTDVIDRLDNIEGVLYHHEGPYDVVNRSRNKNSKGNPIDALKTSNEEALRATPQEKVVDSITKHRPLDGVAYYPPGTADQFGRRFDYEEGYNMMTESEGNFRRWPGMKFRDEDFKNDPIQEALKADAAKRPSWGFGRHKSR